MNHEGNVVDYHTKSGSIYRVDRPNKRMKAIAKADNPDGGPNRGKRLGEGEWRTYETLVYHGEGHPLYFWWGDGQDEFSHSAEQVGEGPAESVRRCTFTSPVVAFVEVG